MKTPEEIKKGLRWCHGLGRVLKGCAGGCPYWDETYGCGRDLMDTDIHTYIQQLEAQVPKWISVEERLPEGEEYVLCWYKDEFGDEWSTVGLKWGCAWDLDIDDNSGRNLTVTHWMPLPKPPKEYRSTEC